MTATLEERVDLMKREIDALQVSITGSTTPWYRQVSTILSAVALLFSFGTTCESYHRTQVQDIENMRQELRGVLQRLAALPKENVEIAKKYTDDPAAMNVVGGFLNQENAMLARHAAELANKLSTESASSVSGTEYYAIAVALQSSYDLNGANTFLTNSIKAARDFNTAISALRAMANLEFLMQRPDRGRVEYEGALHIFTKYPGYDPFTVASTNILTQLSWATSESGYGARLLARQHIESAESILAGLPGSPGQERLRSTISQARTQIAQGIPLDNPVVVPPIGATPP